MDRGGSQIITGGQGSQQQDPRPAQGEARPTAMENQTLVMKTSQRTLTAMSNTAKPKILPDLFSAVAMVHAICELITWSVSYRNNLAINVVFKL